MLKSYFHQLPIPVDEFENKKWFHCIFVTTKIKEEVSYLIFEECLNYYVITDSRKNLVSMLTRMGQWRIYSAKLKKR